MTERRHVRSTRCTCIATVILATLVTFTGCGLFRSDDQGKSNGASADAPWRFPKITFQVGERLPNFTLPRADGSGPISFYSLLGQRNLVFIFASSSASSRALVPGWHAVTKSLPDADELRHIGIVEEQHGERAALFQQWQQLEWPVLVDALNLLDVRNVPSVIAIDEHGIVRLIDPTLDEVRENFLHVEYYNSGRDLSPRLPESPPDLVALAARPAVTAAEARALGDALTVWGDAGQRVFAVDAYRRALELEQSASPTPGVAAGREAGAIYFRLGVALAARHDSAASVAGDFRSAMQMWTRAIELDPENAIWRARLEQFGPRAQQPFPFYDWVPVATRAIRARGEEPRPLSAAFTHAELAQPTRASAAVETEEPDLRGRIVRDSHLVVEVDSAFAPARLERGGRARLHLDLRPSAPARVSWNDENCPVQVWLNPPAGCTLSATLLIAPVAGTTRRVEADIAWPQELLELPPDAAITGYALYTVKRDDTDSSLYLRQDFSIALPR
ncbi:MAG: hypothetical protein ACKVX7_14370 [Planctomycetota bacterium]